MLLEPRAASAFAAAGLAAWLFTPVAIAAATRLGFLDLPSGYKGHQRATPYLGGTAIFAGLLLANTALGDSIAGEWPLLACAAVLWAIGTADDRGGVPILARVAAEVVIAAALWATGDGWHIFGADVFNLPLTVVWIVGVVNAFNLMDNMDGAAASAAAVSAAGAGALSLLLGSGHPAPLCFAVAGACVGFLPYNLARPARVFMGDGGSLPLGLLVGALTIVSVRSSYDRLGPTGVIVGGLLVGLVILDTALVTYSRARGGRPLFSGARDHLTHRVIGRIGSARSVAAVLALGQLAVCALAIAVARAGVGWVLLAGGVAMGLGAALIWQFEHASLLARGRPSRAEIAPVRVLPDARGTERELPERRAERVLA